MAIIKVVNSKAGIKTAINYVSAENKTKGIISGINCTPETADIEMQKTKEFFNKTGGRQYKHYVQSFSEVRTTAEEIHDIAKKLAQEKFPGYEVLIATHQDTNKLHTHFIVNSVSFLDGKKYQESRQDLQNLKDTSDKIIRKYGMIAEMKSLNEKNPTSWSKEKNRALKKENSYMQKIFIGVKEAKETAINETEFIKILSAKNIKVDMNINHKYITFADEAGHKVRDKNLSKTYHIKINRKELNQDFKNNFIQYEFERRPEEKLKKELAEKSKINMNFYWQNGTVMRMDSDFEKYGYERTKAIFDNAEKIKGDNNLAIVYDEESRKYAELIQKPKIDELNFEKEIIKYKNDFEKIEKIEMLQGYYKSIPQDNLILKREFKGEIESKKEFYLNKENPIPMALQQIKNERANKLSMHG